ncbi:LacI family DNA-binding transcriptional regulator [Hyphomonas sp.]|uniref:LacI family DNA-binding transcriptional regulator n=1 Tax=Hyphomonas sp. TaxID=87 RepID=UPI0032EAB63F
MTDESRQDSDSKRRTPVTIIDIARMANVSKKTVSRVINESPLVREETREIVKQIIKETGFTPNPQARALAFRRSFLIGLVYDNPSPQYVVNMQRGILDALDETSFQLVLRPCDRADANYRERVESFVIQHKPFGLILTPSVSEDDELAEMLRERNCAYVRIASVEIDKPDWIIRTHDAQGAELAARHLAQLGHKRIGLIHGPNTFRSTHERMAGFTKGLADFGLTLDPALTIEGAYTFDSGVQCATTLLHKQDRPTAIFAGNDEMAVGVYVAARKAGLQIPQDLSIVGFDDTPISSRIWPPMTTVRSPIRDVGRAAARRLIQVDGGSSAQPPGAFALELIVRESTEAL